MDNQHGNMTEESPENFRANSNTTLDYFKLLSGRRFPAFMDSVTDELENSQIKIAGRLQAAYFRCNNNLRLYDKVNLHTSQARGLHEYSVSLMKKFVVTSNEIAKTMIPLATEAADVGENDSIISLFPLAITCARDMGENTCGIKDSYVESITHLRETIDFEKGGSDMEEEFQGDLKENIIRMKEEAGEIEEELRNVQEDGQGTPTILIDSNQAEKDTAQNHQHSSERSTAIVNEFCEWCRSIFLRNSETQQANPITAEEYQAILKQKKLSIEVQINILEFVKYLEEALHYMEKTSKCLKKLARFWEDIAVELGHMITGQQNGLSSLYSFLEEHGAESFMRYWQKFKEDWENVSETCSGYIMDCESSDEHSIKALYSYTSYQI